ncbi:Uncharacterised protein [uncultured Clostridium sp.]|uniref:hypothetical protein n=1 Tax=uncultured Clostridium sp. TaxID=59620 RepID=UPI000820E41F|nr:hypothetical protein [uncultured Clostridium sp.]SCK02312.1 Uncharacterised protein [uncultured Clostridium sp.]
MRNNICIKCHSRKIVKVGKESRYNNALYLNAFKNAIATKYICCDCGYFEEYYENEKDREAIYKTYSE